MHSAIAQRFASDLVNPAHVKPHPKEVTELAEEAVATAQQFKNQANALAALDEKLAALDRQRLVAATAKSKNKAVENVTDLEVAEYQLAEREKFVQSIDLTTTPLFSAKVTLERFLARKKDIDSLGPIPTEAKTLLEQEEQRIRALVDNEIVDYVEMEPETYERVKANLFPSFKARISFLNIV